jgi:hypothetical protein
MQPGRYDHHTGWEALQASLLARAGLFFVAPE